MSNGAAPAIRSVETLVQGAMPSLAKREDWPIPVGSRKVRVEALVASDTAHEGSRETRPWPIHGSSIATFTEDAYQRACAQGPPTSGGMTVCLKRQLFLLDHDAFVAAAFQLITSTVPSRTIWHFYADALKRGTIPRQQLLDVLSRGEHGDPRPVVIFDEGCLRQFVDLTGIGLKDVLALLLGLVRRQARRRAGLLFRRVRCLFDRERR